MASGLSASPFGGRFQDLTSNAMGLQTWCIGPIYGIAICIFAWSSRSHTTRKTANTQTNKIWFWTNEADKMWWLCVRSNCVAEPGLRAIVINSPSFSLDVSTNKYRVSTLLLSLLNDTFYSEYDSKKSAQNTDKRKFDSSSTLDKRTWQHVMARRSRIKEWGQ